MASSSVPRQIRVSPDELKDHRGPLLPMEDIDRASDLIYQATGILGLIRCASSSDDEPPDDALPGACMCVEAMLRELSEIVSRKAP